VSAATLRLACGSICCHVLEEVWDGSFACLHKRQSLFDEHTTSLNEYLTGTSVSMVYVEAADTTGHDSLI
jgi:hypothetical protein